VKKLHEGVQGQEEDFKAEAKVMGSLRPHENVVTFLGCCLGPPGIVTVFYERGSLQSYLKERRDDPLDLVISVGILRDIAAGLSHLHHEKVIHRDLASRNILVCIEA
jgi:serine/threonine protein kinase